MTGKADDPLLLALAKAISDGTPVEWDNLPATSDPDVLAIIDELKRVEDVAKLTNTTPTTWGGFELLGEIGRGRFGTVYRALDPTLQREVALKVIGAAAPGTPFDAEKALWEARSLAKIDHPNVVRVFSATRVGDEVGMSMELVRGRTLVAIVEGQAPFSASEAALIGQNVCRALAAVHRAEKLHGDVKAHNVMREDGGRTVLMDFGTGRDLGTASQPDGPDLAGTPAYLAPEVFAGAPRSKASDLYSVGVLLYYMVSGRYPIEADTRTQVERHHERKARPRPLRDVRPDLPAAFIQVVDRALSERPEDRPRSAGELEAALNGISQGPRRPTVRNWTLAWAITFLLVIGIGGAGAYLVMQPSGATTSSPPLVTTTPGEYRIAAALYGEREGREVKLSAGARISQGERLSLQLQSSVPAHVYVINEDDQGESYLLFPLPGQALRNPLPAGESTRLPGVANGERVSWQVTSQGGREHFIIVASPEPSPVFDRLVASIPPPKAGRAVRSHRLNTEALDSVRGVGGLNTSEVPADWKLRNDPNFATPLPDSEETTHGLWIRRLTLENPLR